MSLLRENERVDELGRKGYRVIQDPASFCFGIDAVLLSWFAKAEPGERIIDLGTGSGVFPILMEARYDGGSYVGLEIREDAAERAQRSVELNGLTDRIRIECGDLKEASARFGSGSFDVVTTNPPYVPEGQGLINPDPGKAAAKHELFCTLEDVIRESAALLKQGGRFYMVHRPARLSEILRLFEGYGLQPSRLQFVHSTEDKEAVLLLVSARKGGREQLKVDAPLIVYHADGTYTEQVRKIYDE